MDKIFKAWEESWDATPLPTCQCALHVMSADLICFGHPPQPLEEVQTKQPFLQVKQKKPCSKSETKPFFQRPFFCFISLFKSHLFFFTKTVRLSQRLCRKGLSIFKTEMFFHKSSSIFTKALPLPLRLCLFHKVFCWHGHTLFSKVRKQSLLCLLNTEWSKILYSGMILVLNLGAATPIETESLSLHNGKRNLQVWNSGFLAWLTLNFRRVHKLVVLHHFVVELRTLSLSQVVWPSVFLQERSGQAHGHAKFTFCEMNARPSYCGLAGCIRFAGVSRHI